MRIPIFYTCILFCLGTTIKAQDTSATQSVPAEVADKQFLNDLERGEQKPLPPAFRGAAANGPVENSPIVKERESQSRPPEKVADKPLQPSRETSPIPNIHEGTAALEPEKAKSMPSAGDQPASRELQNPPPTPESQQPDMGIASKAAKTPASGDAGKTARAADPKHLAETKKNRKTVPIASDDVAKTKSAGVTFEQAPVGSRIHAGQGAPLNDASGVSEATPREGVSPTTATDFGGGKRETTVQQKQYVTRSGQVITVTKTTTFTAPPERDERDRDKGFFHRLFRRQIDMDPAD